MDDLGEFKVHCKPSSGDAGLSYSNACVPILCLSYYFRLELGACLSKLSFLQKQLRQVNELNLSAEKNPRSLGITQYLVPSLRAAKIDPLNVPGFIFSVMVTSLTGQREGDHE